MLHFRRELFAKAQLAEDKLDPFPLKPVVAQFGLLLLGLVVSACVFLAEIRKKKIIKDIIHASNFTTEK